MNAHALAARHTAPPEDSSTQAWIEHCAAIQCAWSALEDEIRSELEGGAR